jgi:hypothetical protein
MYLATAASISTATRRAIGVVVLAAASALIVATPQGGDHSRYQADAPVAPRVTIGSVVLPAEPEHT